MRWRKGAVFREYRLKHAPPAGDPRDGLLFNVFFDRHAGYPYYSDAVWFLTQMRRWGQIAENKPDQWYFDTAKAVYRPDLYMAAAKELVADKACDSAEFRRQLRRRGIKPTIPTFERRKRKKPKRGRPIRVGPSYRQRWKVERCFGWMDNCRRLVVRYDRHLHIYRAFCLLAFILLCLQRLLK